MELSKTKASLYATLSSKKMRLKHGLFMAEGEKCVLDTLGAFIPECLIATPEWIEAHPELSKNPGMPVFTASPSQIKKISSLSTPAEVMAVFKLPESDNSLPVINPEELYLLLDGIQDPGNLGTIIRTADWFGITKIFASPDTANIYNPKTVQSTMGSLKRVKIIYTPLKPLISSHPDMPVYGMVLNGKDIYKSHLTANGFIIMGNEGKGISADLLPLVSDPLLIPPYREEAHGESLNVAIATAITLSQFRNGCHNG